MSLLVAFIASLIAFATYDLTGGWIYVWLASFWLACFAFGWFITDVAIAWSRMTASIEEIASALRRMERGRANDEVDRIRAMLRAPDYQKRTP